MYCKHLAFFLLHVTQSKAYINYFWQVLISVLNNILSQVQGPLVKLYDSREDGMSFNRIVHKTLGYGGPTLLVIQDTEGSIFGGMAPSRGKASNAMFGESGGFLFRYSSLVETSC